MLVVICVQLKEFVYVITVFIKITDDTQMKMINKIFR